MTLQPIPSEFPEKAAKTRRNTVRQFPLSGAHSIMIEKLAGPEAEFLNV
jgi:hypothetical protein